MSRSRTKAADRRRRQVPVVTADLDILDVGHRGDGIAEGDNGPVYVPFTLAGERVRARISGSHGLPEAILEASPLRAEPDCIHFGRCGGCLLQHMNTGNYLDFKKNLVTGALKGRNIEAQVDPVIAIPPASRRRAVFSARRSDKNSVVFGYSERRSHAIVEIASCPILSDDLASHLDIIRTLAGIATAPGQTLKIHATLYDSGLDVVLADGREDATTRQRLLEAALTGRVARLGFPDDPIVETVPPLLQINGIDVRPPPGAFLQASIESENALAETVLSALQTSQGKPVADLFCGIGPFALRIASFSPVTAIDSDPEALKALDAAWRHTNGLKPVRTEKRDLFRNPLTAKEIDKFAAVVFDPPRAGAERQAHEISRSQVPKIIAVSCDPASLARDLAILTQGGYRITRIQPVDQFVYAPHIEVVAICERE